MNDSFNETDFGALYRRHLESQIDKNRIRRDKEVFLERHFQKIPALTVGQYLPVCVLTLLLLVLVWTGQPAAVRQSGAAVRSAPEDALLARPSVEVRRISSRTGPTIVYQKMYQEHPITVIWVLQGRGV